MPKLSTQKCVACEGGVKPLTSKDFHPLLEQVPQWKVINGKQIEREFQFKDFKTALAFVNSIAKIAEKEKHHPDLFLHSWNKVRITLYTHAIGGLSKNDFIVAAKVDMLVKK